MAFGARLVHHHCSSLLLPARLVSLAYHLATLMNPYYIYALKDPRTQSAQPFYIGKGTGNRAWEHTLRVDQTAKGKRIQDIQIAGHEVITAILADDLTEAQALKLEAELISAFGTQAFGGPLTNTVLPSGLAPKARGGLVVPTGVVEKAQVALELLKDSVMELAKANPSGITNADAARSLGLQSSYSGGAKDYLSYSILGLLMGEGKIARLETKKHVATIK